MIAKGHEKLGATMAWRDKRR